MASDMHFTTIRDDKISELHQCIWSRNQTISCRLSMVQDVESHLYRILCANLGSTPSLWGSGMDTHGLHGTCASPTLSDFGTEFME